MNDFLNSTLLFLVISKGTSNEVRHLMLNGNHTMINPPLYNFGGERDTKYKMGITRKCPIFPVTQCYKFIFQLEQRGS